jgi:hypothetical protein
VTRLPFALVLDHRCRRLGVLTLVERIRTSWQQLLASPLPAHPPVVTLLHHLAEVGAPADAARGDPRPYTLSGITVREGESGGEGMEFKAGDRVKIESESTERPTRTGVISEVVHGAPSPRYRISWDDGHESIYTPAAGALGAAEPAKRA